VHEHGTISAVDGSEVVPVDCPPRRPGHSDELRSRNVSSVEHTNAVMMTAGMRNTNTTTLRMSRVLVRQLWWT